MDEEINYSTVTFKNNALSQTEEKEDLTVYSEVKPKETPVHKEMDLTADPIKKPKDQTTAEPKAEADRKSSSRLLLLGLGTLSVLLVVIIIALVVVLVHITMTTSQQEATINDLTAKNQLLSLEMKNVTSQNQQLMNETQEMNKSMRILQNQRDDLNWTLTFILTFDSFPVKIYCPNKMCQPCLNGWIQFKENCYLFSKQDSSWINWDQSRQNCQNQIQSADLVVINNLEEQIFVSNQSQYYYDQWHGYWLGLQQINNNWTWIDGHVDTLRYWMPQPYGASGSFALLVPKPNNAVPPVIKNWDTSDNLFQLRFICEIKALIRSV